MSAILKLPLNGGYVSTGADARSADDLESGELQSMSGAFYRKNDRGMAWKMPGRSEFGSAGSGGVKGIAICQFDEGGTDKLVASIGTTLVAATPGATGTFASLVTGLNSSATVLTAAQQEDRWFLGNGYDDNLVLMPDGTTRAMGMKAPTEQPTCTPGASVAKVATRPMTNTVITGGWTNPTLAYDPDATATTFSHVTIPVTPDQNWDHEWSGWLADTSLGRVLRINWGASIQGGLIVQFSVSYDNGSNWDIIYGANQTPYSEKAATWLEVPVTTDSQYLKVRARAASQVYDSGSTARIYDIRVELGDAGVNTTTTGIYYATTEVYAGDGYTLESPPSPLSGIVTLSSQGSVVIARPTLINSFATHWRVYRIADGVATTYQNYGMVNDGDIGIGSTTWTDPLTIGITVQGTPVIPLVSVGDTDYFRDEPALPFKNMIAWKGSICGISRSLPRQWFYSQGGRPESWPRIYVVESFPLDEHDNLVGQMAVGETLVLLCGGAVLALDDVPRVTDGVYDGASARPIKGHPGCVGEYAYTTYSVAGEPRGAWVSPFGVYITNGQTCACISTDLCWEREVNVPYLGTSVLRWDAKNVILWFEFDLDGDGLNDHEMPFHMAEAHSKGEARPKLGQPTAKATSCMASALIDSAHYRFSGHPSDGSVYVEEVGTVDEATGSEVESVVRSGQVGREMINLGVIKATLSHSDFGTGETGTFTATLYRDSSNSENSREQSIRLDGNRGTTIGIGRAGDLVDVEITYSGPGTGGFGDVSLEVEGHGRSGSAPRVTSNSATP